MTTALQADDRVRIYGGRSAHIIDTVHTSKVRMLCGQQARTEGPRTPTPAGPALATCRQCERIQEHATPDEPTCPHADRSTLVTNQPGEFDPSRPHAAASICARPACVAQAMSWVLATTGEAAWRKPRGPHATWTDTLPGTTEATSA